MECGVKNLDIGKVANVNGMMWLEKWADSPTG
jgi:hypothetical protein